MITFSNAQPSTRSVSISQVVSESQLVEMSDQLERALHNRQYHEYCSLKVANSSSDKDQAVWQFLQVSAGSFKVR